MMLPPKSKPQVRTAELVLRRASCFPGDRQSLGYPLPIAITGRTLHLLLTVSPALVTLSHHPPLPHRYTFAQVFSLLPQSPSSDTASVALLIEDCKTSFCPSECAPPQQRPTLISLCPQYPASTWHTVGCPVNIYYMEQLNSIPSLVSALPILPTAP